jgi:hypothetical protein
VVAAVASMAAVVVVASMAVAVDTGKSCRWFFQKSPSASAGGFF